MTGKWTNVSKRMLFAYLMLVGLIFLFTPARVTNRLQLAYASAFRVPLATGRTVTLASRTAPGQTAGASADTVSRLRNDIAHLQAQLREANTKVNLLAQVRTKPEWDRMAFPLADVTVANPGELIVNRGRIDGVAVGHYVMAMSDHSLIGQVSDVSPHTAKVRLIGDPASRVPVEIGLSGIQGLMEGRGGGIAKVPFVSTQRTVSEGDIVYVRKGEMLDVPMVVGRVAKCRKDPDEPLLWDITVSPTCDLAALDRVAVVIPGP